MEHCVVDELVVLECVVGVTSSDGFSQYIFTVRSMTLVDWTGACVLQCVGSD